MMPTAPSTPEMADQPMSTGAGTGSARRTASSSAATMPTSWVARTRTTTVIRRLTSPPPKSPAPHVIAAKSPNTITDAGPNGPPSPIDEGGLGCGLGVRGDGGGQLHDDIGHVVVPVGWSQVDHLEVGRQVAQQ